MKKLNFLTKLLLLCIMIVGGTNGAWAQTILFQQNFNSGTLNYSRNLSYTKTKTLSNIVGDGDNLFTSLTCGNTVSTGIAINSKSGGNDVDATGFFQAYHAGNYCAWSMIRTKDFATTAPTAIKMSLDLWVNRLSGTLANGWPGIIFAMGDGFTESSTANPAEDIIHSAFTISAGNANEDPSIYDFKNSNYATHTKLYSTALTQSTWLSITWVINNTGETLTYDNPTGSGTSTVDNDCFDLWLKTQDGAASTYTRIVAGQAATTTTKDIQEMFICYPSKNGQMEFRMDNILVTDLTPASEAKDYTVTVLSNNDSYGTVTSGASSLDEGETTQITAAAETGYKFRNWSVSGTAATLSSTTTNPTTLTMGTANATVTATFSALETYTITYNKGANGSGDAIADGEKTEDADFTLSSSKYTRSGYAQTGWSTIDGGDKAYDLGGTYTGNAALDLYPFWTETYTITYDNNGGMGSMMATTGAGEVTLRATGFVKSGHSFLGWATSDDNADAGIVEYADQDTYTLSADVTLYAVWGENYCVMKVATSGDAITAGDAVSMQSGAFGGTMAVESTGSNLSYGGNGITSPAGYNSTLTVTLNDYMKPGTDIVLTLHNFYAAGNVRGYKLVSSNGTEISTMSYTTANASQFVYTVTAEDALNGTNSFKLVKVNTNGITIKSLTVTDCQPGGVISASGWNTYSSNKKLDLSTISGGTAYIATTIDNTENKVKMVKCTDIVDAEEGLMIKGTAGDKFTINTSSSAATLSETNLMRGLPNGGSVSYGAGNYVFGWPTATPANYGFYFVNSSAATLGIGKSYLHVDGGGSARLTIVFDEETEETTGISASLNDKEQMTNDKVVYDLQGRKVAQPARGLYIVGGKKVIIK